MSRLIACRPDSRLTLSFGPIATRAGALNAGCAWTAIPALANSSELTTKTGTLRTEHFLSAPLWTPVLAGRCYRSADADRDLIGVKGHVPGDLCYGRVRVLVGPDRV